MTQPAKHRARAAVLDAPTHRSLPGWVERLLGSDPGQQRLRTASQAVATIGVAMAAEWLFVHLTHALQIDTHGATLPAEQAALVAAQHHGMLVIAIMLGAIVGMMASFSGAMFASPRQILVNFALIPVPMVAGLCLGLVLADHRVLALASLAIVLALGAYCRRFGPSGFVGGMLVFMGNFFGFFLHAEVGLADVGWLAAEIGVGTLVAILAQFTMFYPGRRAALRRMVGSFTVRAREVCARALELFDQPEAQVRTSRSLQRRLVRFNETALLIDAQLGNPAALPAGWTATELHQILFDSELAVSTVARLAERIATLDLDEATRYRVREALRAVGELDAQRAEAAGQHLLRWLHESTDAARLERSDHIVMHRFATSVVGFAETAAAWRRASTALESAPDQSEKFQPAVPTMGGWLPGSAMVSAAASLEPGARLRDRRQLQPYTRAAIQMCVAVTGAIVLGDLLSGRRFYWAVIAAFVTFMGANNAGEQVRKGVLRVIGTVVGVFLGALGAHLVGTRTPAAIAVILISLFLGLYLMRISYAFMVVGITIMVSQLYVQLDEFSDSLLRLRLEETALGATVAVITVLCVVPLRTGRVIRVGARQYLDAMSACVNAATARLVGDGSEGDLRSALRRLDGAYQSLTTVITPAGVPLAGRVGSTGRYGARLLQGAAAARHYARNLHVDAERAEPVEGNGVEDLRQASKRLTDSIQELVAASAASSFGSHTYTRSAALFDAVADQLPNDNSTAPRQLALRDLQLIDGALAALAEAAGVGVAALDTSGRIKQRRTVAPIPTV